MFRATRELHRITRRLTALNHGGPAICPRMAAMQIAALSATTSRRVLVALLAFGTALLGSESRAHAVNWSNRYPGVDYATFVTYGANVYATRVNLCYPGIRMRATGLGEGPRTVQSFGEL